MSRLHFNVAGDPMGDVPILVPDAGAAVWLSGVFSGVPINRWSVEIPAALTGGATVAYGPGAHRFRVIVPPGDGDWEAGQPPCLPPEYGGDAERVALRYRAALPRLVPRGHVFRQAPDTRFYGIMASAFSAYERYLKEGPDAIRPVLEQRQALGFNMQRVWTAYDVPLIGRLVPRDHLSFYDRLPAFCDLLARYGQYAYVTALTGRFDTTIGNSPAAIRSHVARVEAAIAPCSNALSDRRNEADHAANTAARGVVLDPAPSGLLWSEGSGQQDVHPPEPFGPFYAFHPASFEWQRKVGKQGWEVDNDRPCVSDETMRVEHGNEPLYRIEDAAACGQMFGAGACFHSPAGKLFTLYSGYELYAAQAWVRGSTRFPLDVVQDGHYVNMGAVSPPLLRVYEKRHQGRVARLEIRL